MTPERDAEITQRERESAWHRDDAANIGDPAEEVPLAPRAPQATPICKDAVEGEWCHAAVSWAMAHGIHKHPAWYPNLTAESTFHDFQAHLYAHGKATCQVPCTPEQAAEIQRKAAAEEKAEEERAAEEKILRK